ncbi:hypothetical protein ES703_76512 [subsurface metagenome]
MAETPEEMGVPKWTGTPEENSKLLLAATRLFGAGELGFAELDSTYRNKLMSVNTKGGATGLQWIDTDPADIPPTVAQPIVYEDVPEAYYTDEKYVCPTSQHWVLFIGGPEPRETDKTAISRISKSNLVSNSTIRKLVYFSTFNFLRALGYHCFGGTGHGRDAFQTGQIAVLTGCSETARMSNWPLSIAYGPRAYDIAQIIDMPVAPTHPVDAGMWRFCQTCGLCAEACPPGAIPGLEVGEPSYEMPPIEGKPDTQHAHGPKLFWYNGSLCNLWRRENYPGSGCSLCAACCSFSVGNEAMIHNVIKGTVATTGLFNSFFASMNNFFGYGTFKDPEEWWDMSLPMFGIDSTVTAWDGGYRK